MSPRFFSHLLNQQSGQKSLGRENPHAEIHMPRVHPNPEMVYDLPAGGRRLTQRCDGYIATLVAGQPIFENQQATGALPGQLMRAGQKG